MQIKEIIEKSTSFLKNKQIETARLDSELILANILSLSRVELYLKHDRPLDEPEVNKMRELIVRRGQGEPVAYIIGEKWFYNRKFKVNQHTLVPRPETEFIVEKSLEWIKAQTTTPRQEESESLARTVSEELTSEQLTSRQHSEQLSKQLSEKFEIKILDLGTGTGCIPISIIDEITKGSLGESIKVSALAVDISVDTLTVAKENAVNILSTPDLIGFLCVDASSEQAVKQIQNKAPFNIIISNPPYISPESKTVEASVKKFEPNSALFAPDNGELYLKDWSEKYSKLMAERGIMIMELDPEHSENIKRHFDQLNVFSHTTLVKDLSGLTRFIFAEKK